MDEALNHIERWKNHFAALPQLNLQLEDVSERLPGLLVGQLPDHYLIVTKPRAVGIDKFIKVGRSLRVVHLFEGNVYGFETTILSHTDSPSRLMFLSYPASIELVELRRHARLNAHIPASLLLGEEIHAGVLWDLSLGGCRFVTAATEHSLEVGQEILLSVMALGSGQPLEIYGAIRSLSRQDSRLVVGLQFDEKRCGTRLKFVADYVNQVLNVLNGD